MSIFEALPHRFWHLKGFVNWLNIKENPWLERGRLRKIQDGMFRSVFRHAYENVPFYHRLYKGHGIGVDDVRSLDDIDKLPVISKQDLLNLPLQERFSHKFDIANCRVWRTSGTTGEPFRSYFEPSAHSYHVALWLRRLQIYGYRPWYTIVIFGPFWASDLETLKNRRLAPGFLNLVNFDANRLSLSDSPEENVQHLVRIDPDVIWCPPSYMRLLAQIVKEIGVEDVRPKIIICGAEMLDPPSKEVIESTFGVEVFDEYGTTDVASRAIAWQCGLHDGYHINEDAIHIQFLRDGERVSAGEEGDIVATNLFRHANPVIKYRIGDAGIPYDEPCGCGRSFGRIKHIVGRSDDFLVMPDGRLVSPFSAMFVCEKVPGVRRFQIVQEKSDRIVIYVEGELGASNIDADISSNCKSLFGDNVHVEIVHAPIRVVRGRKHRVVTSKM